MLLIYENMTYNIMCQLTDDLYTTLVTAETAPPNMVPPMYLAPLFYPLLNPSGIWADYNPAFRLWSTLSLMAQQGEFDSNFLPPCPLPSDYTNTTAARTLHCDLREHKRLGIF